MFRNKRALCLCSLLRIFKLMFWRAPGFSCNNLLKEDLAQDPKRVLECKANFTEDFLSKTSNTGETPLCTPPAPEPSSVYTTPSLYYLLWTPQTLLLRSGLSLKGLIETPPAHSTRHCLFNTNITPLHSLLEPGSLEFISRRKWPKGKVGGLLMASGRGWGWHEGKPLPYSLEQGNLGIVLVSGNHKNTGNWPCAKQMPYQLCYCSSPSLIHL